MSEIIDLDGYFARIGFSGPRAATLDTLRAIHARHAEAIAFENVNPFMGWPVPLDVDSLERKLIRGRRGGYCYEHNLLLSHVLTALGFHVTGLAARVLWNAPEGSLRARSHMVLRIDLDEQPYIADVGFGGQTLTGPLRLEPDTEQATPHEPFRLLRAPDGFTMQSKINGTWSTLYRFDLQPQLPPDYEVLNYYAATHPRSHFTTDLMAARPAADRRYALRNNRLTVHHLDGRTEQRVLTSASELRTVFREIFLVDLPDAPELDAALARLASGPP